MLTERLTAIFVRPPLRPRLKAEVGPWTSISTFGEIAAPILDDLSMILLLLLSHHSLDTRFIPFRAIEPGPNVVEIRFRFPVL